MPKNSHWNIDDIHKARFTLSIENPITAHINTFSKKSKSCSFDMHYELELGIVLKGGMQRHYENYKVNLEPGEIWLCGMWEPHGFKITRDNSKIIVFVILPQMVADLRFVESPDFNGMSFFTTPPKNRLCLTRTAHKETLDLGKRFEEIICKDRSNKVLRLKLLFTELLLNIKENTKELSKAEIQPSGSYSLINKAIRIALENKQLLTEQEVAKNCGISRNAFNHYFEKMMGVTFSKFALRHRLSSAAFQLARTEDPVKAIAVDWGFTDASHLYHCFLKHYGCSLVEYRNKFRR